MTVDILVGDCRDRLRELPDESVQCVVTSPPYYGLRSYGTPPVDWPAVSYSPMPGLPPIEVEPWTGDFGLEPTPEMYIGHMVLIFRAVWRVLREDGVVWLNIGDSYAANRSYQVPPTKWQSLDFGPSNAGSVPDGLKPKDLIGIPWRLAFALQADGWWLRSDVIWHKPNPMPESVTDRPTKAHEYVFLLSKAERYFYDHEAIKEEAAYQVDASAKPSGEYSNGSGRLDGGPHRSGGFVTGATRNKRSVWTIATKPFSGWTEISRLVRVALDDVSDGTMRKPSPDCPVHANQDRPGGERVGENQNHNLRTDGRHAQAQPSGHDDSSTYHAQQNQDCSLDSQDPQHSLSATDRNSQTRKKDPAPVTNLPYKPSAQNPDHTGRKSTQHDSYAPDQNSGESKSGDGERREHLGSQNPDRTVRNELLPVSFEALDKSLLSECTCQFYHEVTEKTSHFAVMPPDLVEPCIKAGTSEHGCCPECGAPWERVVEKPDMSQRPTRAAGSKMDTDEVHLSNNWQGVPKSAGQKYQAWRNENPDVTTGWQPTCNHDAAPVPCTVLDPFGGAGTVGLVADRLKRDAILVELNEDYAEMARRRIVGDAPLLTNVRVSKGDES